MHNDVEMVFCSCRQHDTLEQSLLRALCKSGSGPAYQGFNVVKVMSKRARLPGNTFLIGIVSIQL